MAESKYDDEGNLVGEKYKPIDRGPAKKTAAKKTAKKAAAKTAASEPEPTPSDVPAENEESA